MKITTNRIALGILCYFVLLSLNYGIATPIFEAPDEFAHTLYAHNILKDRALPRLLTEQQIITNDDPTETWSIERHQPALYYLMAAVLIAPTNREHIREYLQPNPLPFIRGLNTPAIWLHPPADSPVDQARQDQTELAVWILRLVNLGIATGSLWLIYRTARLMFPKQASVSLLALLIIVASPNFNAVSVYATNDVLTTFLFTAGVFVLVNWWQNPEKSGQRSAVSGQHPTLALPLQGEGIKGRGPGGLAVWFKSHFLEVILSLILACIALTKLTGLPLFGVIYLPLIVGAYQGRFSWQFVRRVIGRSLVFTAVIAGWWYVRNLILYHDPLASDRSVALWGHADPVDTLPELARQMRHVWESYWLRLGNDCITLPTVRKSDATCAPLHYYAYVDVVILLGLVGAFLGWRKKRESGAMLALCLLVCLAMIAALTFGVSRIEMSYGRLLYPMMVGFAPLIAFGWLHLLGRRLIPFILAPLLVVALTVPRLVLNETYRPLEIVDHLPDSAILLDQEAESMKLVGYELINNPVEPGDEVRLWLYFQGAHPENPALFVNAFDPTQVTLGGVEFYPGMSPTSALDPDKIYRTLVSFKLTQAAEVLRTRRLDLYVGWHVLAENRYLDWSNPNVGTSYELLIPGATLINVDLPIAEAQVKTDVLFADSIRLAGYSLSASEISPGDTLTILLQWHFVQRMASDYNTVIGLMDAEGNWLVKMEEAPVAYPTSAWLPAPDFTDQRELLIPADAPPGDYQLTIGWIDPVTGDLLSGGWYQSPVSVR